MTAVKKFIFFIPGLVFSMTLNAQTWKAPIHRTTGKPVERTLKLRPKMHVNIGTLLLETDSLKESKYYSGSFIGNRNDSLQIRLDEVRIYKNYENGIKAQTTIPVKYFLDEPSVSSDIARIAITDIDVLKYRKEGLEKISSAEDFVLLSSLAVLLISPLICINYKEGTFNAERYQYWALGSTAGIIVGISLQITGGQKQLQFRPGWPENDAQVWSFKQ